MLVDNSLPSHFSADFSDFINTDLFAPPTSLTSTSPSSDNESSPPQSPFHSLLTTPPQDLPPAAFPEFDPSSFASTSGAGSDFTFFEDDPLKSIDPMTFDFMSLPGMQPISLNYPGSMDIPMDLSMRINTDPAIPVDGPSTSELASYLGIDPSLVGTPALTVSTSELETVEEESSDESPEPNSQQKSKQGPKQDDQRERLTLTITPAKVGGYGKSRKGTVQSGGIVKKSAHPSSSHSRDKENSGLLSTTSGQTPAAIAANAAALKRVKTRAASEAASSVDDAPSPAPSSATGAPSLFNNDDLSIDWRPAPEVLAKMTSKEKRQLRNKISARNFRVRRKEYITTLEGDIAERDRLLDAVRSELGSTQSENLALRQEIAALKKILLEGGGVETLNLPPPAPLTLSNSGSLSASSASSGSAVAVSEAPTSAPASTASSSTGVIDPALTPHSSSANANVSLALPTPSPSPFLTPNTQKDLPTSPRLGAAAFWGGTTRPSFGMMGGGITPVHTVLVPDLSASFGAGVGEGVDKEEKCVTRALQENMNPALNGSLASKSVNTSSNLGSVSNMGGFEGWADLNPLTMKTLDAYRMHLWGKMAAQQQFQRNQQAHTYRSTGPAFTGLASSLRPQYFASSSTSSSLYPTPPSTPPLSSHHGFPMGSTLSALLSGKHSASSSSSNHSGLPTPPASPSLKNLSDRESDRFREKEREQREHAALAAIAGQTLFKKLGNAFWDAFSGNSSTTVPTLSSKSNKDLDVDKVRKVLEGKAVVRVVDVEPSTSSGSMSALTASLSTMNMDDKKVNEKKCMCANILEESMKSLTVSKKV